MIENVDDFCLWVYGMVDDIWAQIAPLFRRPGPQAECSDSKWLTMALVGEVASGLRPRLRVEKKTAVLGLDSRRLSSLPGGKQLRTLVAKVLALLSE